jgi:hypothetical protein
MPEQCQALVWRLGDELPEGEIHRSVAHGVPVRQWLRGGLTDGPSE